MSSAIRPFLISFFPIAVSVGIGLSTLEPEYRDILRAVGASRVTIFRKIALPKTLPEFFGALTVAVTLAFIGTNIVEIVLPHGLGLGALLQSRATNDDYLLMFAVLMFLPAPKAVLFWSLPYDGHETWQAAGPRSGKTRPVDSDPRPSPAWTRSSILSRCPCMLRS